MLLIKWPHHTSQKGHVQLRSLWNALALTSQICERCVMVLERHVLFVNARL